MNDNEARFEQSQGNIALHSVLNKVPQEKYFTWPRHLILAAFTQ
jgi:hypothetical protein